MDVLFVKIKPTDKYISLKMLKYHTNGVFLYRSFTQNRWTDEMLKNRLIKTQHHTHHRYDSFEKQTPISIIFTL